jgi:hypothetical protein
MKLPSLSFPAQGCPLCSDSRFCVRLTNTAAFLNTGSSCGTPAAVRASRTKWVLDRSGRVPGPYPNPPYPGSLGLLPSSSSIWEFLRYREAPAMTGSYLLDPDPLRASRLTLVR